MVLGGVDGGVGVCGGWVVGWGVWGVCVGVWVWVCVCVCVCVCGGGGGGGGGVGVFFLTAFIFDRCHYSSVGHQSNKNMLSNSRITFR